MIPVDLVNGHEYDETADYKCVGCEAKRVQLVAHVRGVLVSILRANVVRLTRNYWTSVRSSRRSAIRAVIRAEVAFRRFQESK